MKLPSMFVYEYVEEHYADLLFKVLTRTFGPGFQLNYRILADKEHGKQQDMQNGIPDTYQGISHNNFGSQYLTISLFL